MKRARSRLNKPTDVEQKSSNTTELHKSSLVNQSTTPVQKKIRSNSKTQNVTVNKYLNHSLMLVIAGINFYFIWYIFNNFYPRQVANFIVPGAYLPLVTLFFLGTFFLVSYVLLNSKLGFFFSILLTIGFFLKLHGVLF